jgi:hypothetical protein
LDAWHCTGVRGIRGKKLLRSRAPLWKYSMFAH